MDGKRISFEVPGVPMAWKRARATVRFGHASMFEDKLQTSYKADVRSYLRKQCGKVEAYAGAVSLSLEFVFPLLKSDFKKDGTPSKSGMRKLSGEEAMAKKPDIDNLCKMVMDALNGVAWLDDSQVCLLTAEKRYGSEPKTVICAMGIDNAQEKLPESLSQYPMGKSSRKAEKAPSEAKTVENGGN